MGRAAFQKAVSMLWYHEGGLAQKLIHRLKYRRQEQLGGFLGRWYGSLLRADAALPPVDWVLPVPLHPRKKRRRGYNQCSLFGREIAKSLGASFSERLLVRHRYGPTQTRAGREARAQNALKAFSVSDEGPLRNTRVLLVDDVLTTGATLEGCCRALNRGSSGLELYIATMAVVP